jgi:hypothetical protein
VSGGIEKKGNKWVTTLVDGSGARMKAALLSKVRALLAGVAGTPPFAPCCERPSGVLLTRSSC